MATRRNIHLPHSLHYPITVTELLKKPDEHVKRSTPLFSYSYISTVVEDDDLGNENRVQRSFPAQFASDIEGILKSWKTRRGAIITNSDTEIAEIEEPCAHDIQFGGMCANCGQDMTQITYLTQQTDSSRAPINMIHDNVALKVSEAEAARVEDEAKRRLLGLEKLSLVVDLDQTIIQATVDPTVGDWQNDEANPNHAAVREVRSFVLKDDGPGNRACRYYVKLRPNLESFLENISKIYELHIYTMGTRQYAKNIADIIDPHHRVFGDRILSRDESGSMIAKDLQRLFPVDTKMVVIIDDRGDVWKWSPNLVKVTPYDFFVGIGDINASFLPKKPDLKPPKVSASIAPNIEKESTTKEEEEVEPTANGDKRENGDQSSRILEDENASPLDRLVAMGGGDDPSSISAQSSQQDEAITAQVEDRPLLKKQQQLEEKETEATGDATAKEDKNGNKPVSETSSDSERSRHNLLQDRDRELYSLESSLRMVHTAFFEAYRTAKQTTSAKGGRLGELRGAQKLKLSPQSSDLDLVPDIKSIMPAVKAKVLKGTVIVLSGVVPLGMDIASTDIAIQSNTFGARIDDEITKRTTHLVATRRTQKVRTAIRKGKDRIKIVSPQWLYDSISSWSKFDETPYLLDVGEPQHGPAEDEELLSESESQGSDHSEESLSSSLELGIKIPPRPWNEPGSETGDDDLPDFEYDDKSPIGGDFDDWKLMNDELADFLGPDHNESGTESDAESDRGGSQAPTNKSEGLLLRNGGSSLKRSRHAEDSDDGDDEINGEDEESARKKTRVYKDGGADEDEGPFSGATLVAGEEGDDGSDEEGDLEAELEAAFALEAEGEGDEAEEEEGGGARGSD